MEKRFKIPKRRIVFFRMSITLGWVYVAFEIRVNGIRVGTVDYRASKQVIVTRHLCCFVWYLKILLVYFNMKVRALVLKATRDSFLYARVFV
jgi:hypothetical protein